MANSYNARTSVPIRAVHIETGETFQFKSIFAASVHLPVSRACINDVLKNPNIHSTKGYTFEYVTPQDLPKQALSKQASPKETVEEDVKIGDVSHIDDDPLYRYNDKTCTYEWVSTRSAGGTKLQQNMSIPLDVADALFFEYSRFGKNLSALAARTNHNISIPQWNSLKNRLSLYKDSDIASPITRNSLTDIEYQKLIDKKLEELHLFKKRSVIDKYGEFTIREAENAVKIANSKEYISEYILNGLNEWFTDFKTKEIIVNRTNTHDDTCDNVTAAIADLHMGAEAPTEYNRLGYNDEILTNLLERIANEINLHNGKNVTLLIAGDLIHSITGTMHKTAFKNMQHRMQGLALLTYAVEKFEYLFSMIHNLTKVYSVAGNHDRLTDDFKSDSNGEAAGIIMYMLKRIYSGTDVTIKHDNYLLSEQIADYNIIMLHGNTRSEMKQEGLIHDYGKPGMFNLVLSADKHTRSVLFDTSKSRHCRIPSIFTGDEYSTKLGFSSTPGCLIIKSRGGYPQILDVTMPITKS